MVIIFCLFEELVTRGPSRPTGSTYLGDLAGVSISVWGCGQFLRPQKIGIKKKEVVVPRWMTFFPKIRQFSNVRLCEFFCSPKGPRHHSNVSSRFDTSQLHAEGSGPSLHERDNAWGNVFTPARFDTIPMELIKG